MTTSQLTAARTSRDGHPRRWTILAITSLALLVVVLGNTVLNVALPTLGAQLGASSAQLQWLVDSYILTFAALLLVGGAVGDRTGRRRAFVVGLTIFGLASLAAATATGGAGLIASRAAMGVGAALVMPTTLSIINSVFPDEEKARAMVAWTAVASLGIAVGPTLGGWMVDRFWWGSIFLVNVPVVVVAVIAAHRVIPESVSGAKVPVDGVGAALSVVALGALVHGVIEIPAAGWHSAHATVPLAGAVVAGAAFLAWELRTPHPMVPLQIFRDARFSAVSLTLVLANIAVMGMIFFYTIYTQLVLGFSAYTTGLTIIPAAVAIVLFSMLSARLHHRTGPRLPIALGMAGIGSALLFFGQVGPDWPLSSLVGAQILLGAGVGLSSTAATASLMSALPAEGAGVASAFNDVTREVGALLGVAVLGSIMSAGYTAAMSDAVAGLPPAVRTAAGDSFVGALDAGPDLGRLEHSELMSAAVTALGDGVRLASTSGAVLAAVGVVVAVTLVPGAHRTSRRAAAGSTADAAPG